jgi:hypothetical protein
MRDSELLAVEFQEKSENIGNIPANRAGNGFTAITVPLVANSW